GNACVGAVHRIGGGDGPSLFLDLDPNGHMDTPSTPDICGDLQSGMPVNWTVRLTNLICMPDQNNNLMIESCRVWENSANHKSSCTNLAQAGTGSKCDC